MTFQEIRIIATGPCITNQLRDVNTICRRSWYIAAHIWKIYDFKTEVVPFIINFSTELTTVVGWLIESSITEHTREVYRNGLNCFDQIRESYGLEVVWPPLLSHATIFISYLSLSKNSHNTVSAYLSAIHFCCKIAHHEGFANNCLVSKMLEEMRRVHKTVDTRLLYNLITNMPCPFPSPMLLPFHIYLWCITIKQYLPPVYFPTYASRNKTFCIQSEIWIKFYRNIDDQNWGKLNFNQHTCSENICCFYNFFKYWRAERQLNAYDKNASLIGAFDFTS